MLSPQLIAALEDRRTRLRERFENEGVDAFLVSFPTDIRYLTGFGGEDSLVLIGRDNAWIITDARFDEELEPWRSLSGLEVVMGTRHRLEESVRSLCSKQGTKRLGIQAEQMTVAGRGKLDSSLGDVTLVDTVGVIPSLRMKKDDSEVAAIEKALGIQQAALRAALDQLQLGMTEFEFCALLEYEMKSRGATGWGFDAIIGSGANSSIIHYRPGSDRIEEGALLIDWGAIADGYNGDMTRTFGIGSMPAKIAEIYPIVLEAQLAAIEACAPGRICAEIDAIARDIITKAGYGEYFGHGLGHSLGLEVHESPYFNSLATETPLEPGMVMTVEPGIYLPGVGGVRIEDDVLITGDGCRVLSDWPKQPDEAIIEPAGHAVRS